MSPHRKREAVEVILDYFEVSGRRACKLLKQPRASQPYLLWFDDGSCVRLRSEHKDHVWSYDFVQARTHDGRSLRMLTVIDEHTRECLAIDVARNLRNGDVLERLAWLMATRGVPKCIRSDNGAEFTAKADALPLSYTRMHTYS